MTSKIVLPNADDLIKLYQSGISEQEIARRAGVNRSVITRLLRERSIFHRGRSEAMAARMARCTPEQRGLLTSAAHAAARGRKASLAERGKYALTRQSRMDGAVFIEFALSDMLAARGLQITQQLAAGIYNIDIAVHTPPIAVEIFGGGWHAYGAHARRHLERTKYLLNHGWAVVIVWIDARRYPLCPQVAEYIVTLAEELRGHPSERREYRVILGNGEDAPISRTKLNDPTIIEALGASN